MSTNVTMTCPVPAEPWVRGYKFTVGQYPITFATASQTLWMIRNVYKLEWSVAELLERFGSGGRQQMSPAFGGLYIVTGEWTTGNFLFYRLNDQLLAEFRANSPSPRQVYVPWWWAQERVFRAIKRGGRRLIVQGHSEFLTDEDGNLLQQKIEIEGRISF